MFSMLGLYKLFQFLKDHFGWFIGKLLDIFQWMMTQSATQSEAILARLGEIPALEFAWTNLGPYVVTANDWLPLNLALSLATVWITMKVSVVGVRLALKVIPFIG